VGVGDVDPVAGPGRSWAPWCCARPENTGNEVRSAYDPAGFKRLTEIKAAFDPQNLFRHNHNIPPLV